MAVIAGEVGGDLRAGVRQRLADAVRERADAEDHDRRPVSPGFGVACHWVTVAACIRVELKAASCGHMGRHVKAAQRDDRQIRLKSQHPAS